MAVLRNHLSFQNHHVSRIWLLHKPGRHYFSPSTIELHFIFAKSGVCSPHITCGYTLVHGAPPCHLPFACHTLSKDTILAFVRGLPNEAVQTQPPCCHCLSTKQLGRMDSHFASSLGGDSDLTPAGKIRFNPSPKIRFQKERVQGILRIDESSDKMTLRHGYSQHQCLLSCVESVVCHLHPRYCMQLTLILKMGDQ